MFKVAHQTSWPYPMWRLPMLRAGAGASSAAAAEDVAASPPVAAQGRRGFTLGTFVTGVLYGLQPDALFVVIPALTLPTKMAAAAYCLMFVFGTVTAMGGYTAVIGAPPGPWRAPSLAHSAALVAANDTYAFSVKPRSIFCDGCLFVTSQAWFVQLSTPVETANCNMPCYRLSGVHSGPHSSSLASVLAFECI